MEITLFGAALLIIGLLAFYLNQKSLQGFLKRREQRRKWFREDPHVFMGRRLPHLNRADRARKAFKGDL